MIEFILVIITAILWRVGGAGKEEIKFAKAWYRDTLIPILNAGYFLLTANVFLAGAVFLGTSSIRLGYGAYDPEHDSKPSFLAKLTKDRDGWKIRMLYGGITSFAIGIFPAIYYQSWTGLLTYVCFNIFSEYILNTTKVKSNVWVVELLTGASRGLVFFLCR